MRYCYSLCLALALPFLCLMLWWRYRDTDYNKRWRERLGIITADCKRPLLWLHAASVGEVIAASKLIEHLITHYSHYRLLITTTTPSGAERVVDLFANNAMHCYLPYDLSYCVTRFLRSAKPAALLIMETEVWPNTLAACYRAGIPSILINGRMSARSYRAYQRFARLSQSMFSQLTAVAAQTTVDAKHFQRLGAKNITVSGNIKMDIEITAELRRRAEILAARWSNQGRRRVLIAASTHRGEDERLLQVLRQLKQSEPQLLLVLVPRHPQRFEAVKELCLQQGYRVRCHSEHRTDENTDIIIGDTMGELTLMYGASDIAFIGGSLVDNGGHNVLEPAAWGLPIVIGTSVYNFADIVDGLVAVKGIYVVEDNRQLVESLTELVEDSVIRHQMGRAAYQYIESNKGALEKLLRFLEPILKTLHKTHNEALG